MKKISHINNQTTAYNNIYHTTIQVNHDNEIKKNKPKSLGYEYEIEQSQNFENINIFQEEIKQSNQLLNGNMLKKNREFE